MPSGSSSTPRLASRKRGGRVSGAAGSDPAFRGGRLGGASPRRLFFLPNASRHCFPLDALFPDESTPPSIPQAVLNDIKRVILDRGGLSKEEVRELWQLDEAQYQSLREILDRERIIEPGPKGIGGFRARPIRRQLPAVETASGEALRELDWESAAIDRLAELLDYKQLEEELDELAYALRRARLKQTGEDRRGTKRELAAGLIVKHGRDLFRDLELRRLVAKAAKVENPARWYPGKETALRFVAAAGFPLELAGIPAPEAPADFEYLEGRVDLKPLERFQLEVQEKLLRVLATPGGRAIVTLPTGGGKTRVAVDTIRDFLSERWRQNDAALRTVVLWLAHTEELCEQAYLCFRQVWQASSAVSPLLLFRFWGRFTQDLAAHQSTFAMLDEQPAVLVSTPQRVINLLEGKVEHGRELLDRIERRLVLVVVDEAHRAAAPTYRRIIEETGRFDAEARVVGLTATPFRAEYDPNDPDAGTLELRGLFREIIEPSRTLGPNPRERLEEEGFLARPTWETLRTRTYLTPPPIENLESPSEEDIERIDRALRIRADSPDRRLIVLERVLEICADPEAQVIYFGPSVLDAECMAFLLRTRGVEAVAISGNTREVTRRQVIADFRARRVKVLCNCEVLTTGFDAPLVTHVVMARPTVSQVLYEQMVGRGLRGPRFGGTAHCVIVDLEDNYRVDRPTLGYQQFRRLWLRGRRRRTLS